MISKKEPFLKFIRNLQNEICTALETEDGKGKFISDKWEREGGGGGDTRVISGGNIFEKGGVNTSAVHGNLPESLQKHLKIDKGNFFACGISLVLHPYNPFVPTVHANFRYFELYDENGELADQWFGGGSDMTPYYLYDEDATHFHQVQKTVCDKFHDDFYPTYKKKCDEYFYNSHRSESRGIGGTFFDYLRPTAEQDSQFWFDFVTGMGAAFLETYLPIVQKRKSISFTKKQKHWQEIRRGRYVEFNLIHDRGTLFGLKTKGRIESILMSLPPTVRWEYNLNPEAGSEEDRLINVLKNPKAWV